MADHGKYLDEYDESLLNNIALDAIVEVNVRLPEPTETWPRGYMTTYASIGTLKQLFARRTELYTNAVQYIDRTELLPEEDYVLVAVDSPAFLASRVSIVVIETTLPVQIRMPAGTQAGDRLVIITNKSDYDNEPLLIDHNGLAINGQLEDVQVTTAGACLEMECFHPGLGWSITKTWTQSEIV